MENDFSAVKVNDRVFHVRYGWYVVSATPKTNNSYFEITVTDNLGNFTIKFTRTGRMDESDLNPSVFWDEIKIVPPSKPKRKVERIVEKWLNFYLSSECSGGKTRFYSYESKETADEQCHKETRIGEACHVIHKYTVEE